MYIRLQTLNLVLTFDTFLLIHTISNKKLKYVQKPTGYKMRPSDNVCFGSFQYSRAALFASAAKASSRSLAHVVATTLITTKRGQVFLKSHFKSLHTCKFTRYFYLVLCRVSSKSREIEALFKLRTENETYYKRLK